MSFFRETRTRELSVTNTWSNVYVLRLAFSLQSAGVHLERQQMGLVLRPAVRFATLYYLAVWLDGVLY
jgi:hypothetical protein